uniref:Uncharacterized protein n=1 Tax=Palpitomonas bilix TaxID=652834 RepID=A0A7S3DK72_9EUKA
MGEGKDRLPFSLQGALVQLSFVYPYLPLICVDFGTFKHTCCEHLHVSFRPSCYISAILCSNRASVKLRAPPSLTPPPPCPLCFFLSLSLFYDYQGETANKDAIPDIVDTMKRFNAKRKLKVGID